MSVQVAARGGGANPRPLGVALHSSQPPLTATRTSDRQEPATRGRRRRCFVGSARHGDLELLIALLCARDLGTTPGLLFCVRASRGAPVLMARTATHRRRVSCCTVRVKTASLVSPEATNEPRPTPASRATRSAWGRTVARGGACPARAARAARLPCGARGADAPHRASHVNKADRCLPASQYRYPRSLCCSRSVTRDCWRGGGAPSRFDYSAPPSRVPHRPPPARLIVAPTAPPPPRCAIGRARAARIRRHAATAGDGPSSLHGPRRDEGARRLGPFAGAA